MVDSIPLPGPMQTVTCTITNDGGTDVTVHAMTWNLGGGCGPAQQVLKNGATGSVSCTGGTINGPSCTLQLVNPGGTDCVASMGASDQSAPGFSVGNPGYPLTFVLQSTPGSPAPLLVTIAALG